MNLPQWLAVPYDGPGRRYAALSLALRDLRDGLADGPPGVLHLRWRASQVVKHAERAIGRMHGVS
jgi:hypothetical protein